MKRFRISYGIITHMVDADYTYSGYVTRNLELPRKARYIPKRPARFTLRQVAEVIVPGVGPLEADSYPCRTPRWITAYPDHNTHVTVHLDELTPASARRVARLLGVKLTP